VRVTVTGAAGYLGSVLVPLLLASGHEVRGLDSLLFGGEGMLGLIGHPRFTLMKGDVRSDGDLARALDGTDAVVHLAALVGEPACEADPSVTRDVNLGAVQRVVRTCADRGVRRLVFASTCSNYGITDRDIVADEDTPLNPISLYAETKVQAERVVLDAAAAGVAATVMRFATMFGLAPRPRFDLLANELVRDAVCGRDVMVYGQDAWRPFIHVSDAARAITAVLDAEQGLVAGRVFNVGVGNYRKGDLVRMITEVVPHARISAMPGRRDPRDYRVSFDRIRDSIGFTATKDVRAGVAEMAEALSAGVITDPFLPKYRNA
jgi:nucleoside-diphosphate-sugar epimerase